MVVTERLIVVGGDAAGMSAASQARRRRSEEDLTIVAFERSDYTSYSACGLPYLVSDFIHGDDDLIARSPQTHRANGIDVRLHHEVVAIDTSARHVVVRNLDDNSERVEPFDQLVYATGALPVRPPLPGVDAHGVHGIQNIADGIALRDHVSAHRHAGQHAVVVGGGYIGLEMAESMHERGLPVVVVDDNEQPMSTLDPDMGVRVADAMRRIGIEVRTNTRVQGFETDKDNHVRAVITNDGSLPADVVVLGIGVKPNVDMARNAGIAIGESGGIAVNDRMATNVEGVWAAGDCVASFHRVSGKHVVIALGTHANKQGRVAGTNATGGDARFGGVVGTAVTKICAYEVGRTGLTEREARDAGIDAVSATIESTTRARYYPGAQAIVVKASAERGSGRMLGAQIIGHEGAAKRIDIFAVALWNNMTAEEVTELDLGYAPPFSPVWDPTLIAARKVAALV